MGLLAEPVQEVCFCGNPKCLGLLVARVGTKNFWKGETFCSQRTIRILKRKSCPVFEECFTQDTQEGEVTFTNLYDVEEGLFTLNRVNLITSSEEGYSTGYIESWDWELIPWTDPSEISK